MRGCTTARTTFRHHPKLSCPSLFWSHGNTSVKGQRVARGSRLVVCCGATWDISASGSLVHAFIQLFSAWQCQNYLLNMYFILKVNLIFTQWSFASESYAFVCMRSIADFWWALEDNYCFAAEARIYRGKRLTLNLDDSVYLTQTCHIGKPCLLVGSQSGCEAPRPPLCSCTIYFLTTWWQQSLVLLHGVSKTIQIVVTQSDMTHQKFHEKKNAEYTAEVVWHLRTTAAKTFVVKFQCYRTDTRRTCIILTAGRTGQAPCKGRMTQIKSKKGVLCFPLFWKTWDIS